MVMESCHAMAWRFNLFSCVGRFRAVMSHVMNCLLRINVINVTISDDKNSHSHRLILGGPIL